MWMWVVIVNKEVVLLMREKKEKEKEMTPKLPKEMMMMMMMTTAPQKKEDEKGSTGQKQQQPALEKDGEGDQVHAAHSPKYHCSPHSPYYQPHSAPTTRRSRPGRRLRPSRLRWGC